MHLCGRDLPLDQKCACGAHEKQHKQASDEQLNLRSEGAKRPPQTRHKTSIHTPVAVASIADAKGHLDAAPIGHEGQPGHARDHRQGGPWPAGMARHLAWYGDSTALQARGTAGSQAS